MGGVTSTFRNNSELVDNLVSLGFIKTETVERVFHAVDRGDFFPPEDRSEAYRDLAWNSGTISISSPCVHSQVVEEFNFSPGLSFINLGSGTGYLNIMVGLLLGPNGINHGIEISKFLIEYAYKKVKVFEENSSALDEFNFCRPVFMHGSCFALSDEFSQYDRVYCGAACPPQFEEMVKNLVKVNGILIMASDGMLTSYTRTEDDTWITRHLRTMYMSSMIATNLERVELVKNEPGSLQSLCRSAIRDILRSSIEKEFGAELKKERTEREIFRKKRRTLTPIDDTRELPRRPILDPALFDELIRFEQIYRPLPRDDSNFTEDEESSESSSEEDEPAPTVVHPTTTAVADNDNQEASTSGTGGNLPRPRFLWPGETKVIITDDSDEEPTPVLTISTVGPYYGPSQFVHHTDETADVDVVDDNDDEHVIGNVEVEEALQPEINIDRHENNFDSHAILSPLAHSLARLGEGDGDTNEMSSEPVDGTYRSSYTPYMREKILTLPLPATLKRYLNLDRDFT